MEEQKKYLTVKLVGHNDIRVFDNSEARLKNPNAPHYKSDGVAIWVNSVKPQELPKSASSSVVEERV